MNKVIKVKGNSETSNAVTTIPPGFLPMPAMVTVPILGSTADIKPITVKGNTKDECPDCAGDVKRKLPRTGNVD